MQNIHYSVSFLSKGREHRKSEAHQNSLQGLERTGGEWLNNELRHNSSGKEWNGTYLQNGKHTCRGEEALQKGFGSLSSQGHRQHRAAAEKNRPPWGFSCWARLKTREAPSAGGGRGRSPLRSSGHSTSTPCRQTRCSPEDSNSFAKKL